MGPKDTNVGDGAASRQRLTGSPRTKKHDWQLMDDETTLFIYFYGHEACWVVSGLSYGLGHELTMQRLVGWVQSRHQHPSDSRPQWPELWGLGLPPQSEETSGHGAKIPFHPFLQPTSRSCRACAVPENVNPTKRRFGTSGVVTSWSLHDLQSTGVVSLYDDLLRPVIARYLRQFNGRTQL